MAGPTSLAALAALALECLLLVGLVAANLTFNVAQLYERTRLDAATQMLHLHSEQSFYYSYYARMASASTAEAAMAEALHDAKSEAPVPFVPLRRLNLIAEAVLATVYRALSNAGWLDGDWAVKGKVGALDVHVVIPLDGGRAMHNVYVLCTAAWHALCVVPVYLLGRRAARNRPLGGILAAVLYLGHWDEGQRIRHVALRENAAVFPLWMQMWSVANAFGATRASALTSICTVAAVLPWQFTPFVLATQLIALQLTRICHAGCADADAVLYATSRSVLAACVVGTVAMLGNPLAIAGIAFDLAAGECVASAVVARVAPLSKARVGDRRAPVRLLVGMLRFLATCGCASLVHVGIRAIGVIPTNAGDDTRHVNEILLARIHRAIPYVEGMVDDASKTLHRWLAPRAPGIVPGTGAASCLATGGGYAWFGAPAECSATLGAVHEHTTPHPIIGQAFLALAEAVAKHTAPLRAAAAAADRTFNARLYLREEAFLTGLQPEVIAGVMKGNLLPLGVLGVVGMAIATARGVFARRGTRDVHDAALTYVGLQMVAFVALAILTRRLMILATPLLCAAAGALADPGLLAPWCIGSGRARRLARTLIQCAVAAAMMRSLWLTRGNVEQHATTIPSGFAMNRLAINAPRDLIRFVRTAVPESWRITTEMTYASHLRLHLDRPIACCHPHYENANLQRRADIAYSVYGCGSIADAHRHLLALETDLLILHLAPCYRVDFDVYVTGPRACSEAASDDPRRVCKLLTRPSDLDANERELFDILYRSDDVIALRVRRPRNLTAATLGAAPFFGNESFDAWAGVPQPPLITPQRAVPAFDADSLSKDYEVHGAPLPDGAPESLKRANLTWYDATGARWQPPMAHCLALDPTGCARQVAQYSSELEMLYESGGIGEDESKRRNFYEQHLIGELFFKNVPRGAPSAEARAAFAHRHALFLERLEQDDAARSLYEEANALAPHDVEYATSYANFLVRVASDDPKAPSTRLTVLRTALRASSKKHDRPYGWQFVYVHALCEFSMATLDAGKGMDLAYARFRNAEALLAERGGERSGEDEEETACILRGRDVFGDRLNADNPIRRASWVRDVMEMALPHLVGSPPHPRADL